MRLNRLFIIVRKNKNLNTQGETMQQRKHTYLTTLVLCFFLGHLGIHRFYVGKTGTGTLMLLTAGGLGVWYLIDLSMIILGKFKTKEGSSVIHQVATS